MRIKLTRDGAEMRLPVTTIFGEATATVKLPWDAIKNLRSLRLMDIKPLYDDETDEFIGVELTVEPIEAEAEVKTKSSPVRETERSYLIQTGESIRSVSKAIVEKVVAALRELDEATARQISEKLGLSVTAVNRALAVLMHQKRVSKRHAGGRGRLYLYRLTSHRDILPPKKLKFKPDNTGVYIDTGKRDLEALKREQKERLRLMREIAK